MPQLIGYAILNSSNNSIEGHLVKAQCFYCKKKFGSIQEARRCEAEHIRKELFNDKSLF